VPKFGDMSDTMYTTNTSFTPAAPSNNQTFISRLPAAQAKNIRLRDGEVVLFKRSRSLVYQCRYKLADGSWYRATTGKLSLEHAISAACEMYDEARFRQRLGLAHRAHSIAQICDECVEEMRAQLDAGQGKVVYRDYIQVIEKYIRPYLGFKQLETLTSKDIVQFELWRNRQMTKAPKHSTLNTFSSAWSKLCELAVSRGWISERVPVPKFTASGQKSKPRPAFTRQEINFLLKYMVNWIDGGRSVATREIKPLLRDYVEILLYTGIRHGTEAMNMRWKHLEWYTDQGVRYLRIWVSGKTGGRWLIAKHQAVDVFKRLHARRENIKSTPFEDIFTQKCDQLVFVYSEGYQPHDLRGTFRLLMKDCGLLMDADGATRTLYSLRHTYATLELLENGTDIHTLAKQMGNSVAMIERYYSKLTPTMAAGKLA
jgi:integrase